MSEPRLLLSGLGIPESPRWHEDRLWFCNWIGPDRRTLFILTAEWQKAGIVTEKLGRLTNGPPTGEILALPVSVPGAGRP